MSFSAAYKPAGGGLRANLTRVAGPADSPAAYRGYPLTAVSLAGYMTTCGQCATPARATLGPNLPFVAKPA